MIRRRERVKLIDDPSFAVRRQRVVRKPDAWFRSPKHLDAIRERRCLVCGTSKEVIAAHVRKGTDGAGGKKPSDYFTLPLCDYHHRVQHSAGEVSFWNFTFALDPILTALELAMQSPCQRTREAATEEFRRRFER